MTKHAIAVKTFKASLISRADLGRLNRKFRVLRGHPGFRRAPLLILMRLLFWRLRCLLRIPATIDLPTWNARVFLPAKWEGAGATTIFAMREDYEPELMYFATCLTEGMVVVDGGANCGLYTVVAAKLVGNSGLVLSFEPGAESFSVLERNVRLNRLGNVHALRLALSDGERTTHLYHHRGPNSYSLAPRAGTGLYEEVRTTTIDAMLARDGLDRVDVLKLDVEGAEELVLRGANTVLRESRPMIIFEVYRDAATRLGLAQNGAWDYLAELEYQFFTIGTDGELRRLTLAPDAGNVIAIHSANA